MGTLYYGDNLEIVRRYLKDETVDLVYDQWVAAKHRFSK